MNKLWIIILFSISLLISAKIPASNSAKKLISETGNILSITDTNILKTTNLDTSITKNKSENIHFEKSDRYTKMGKQSLLFGISSFVVGLIPYLGILSLPLAIAAIVLGIFSLKNKKKNNSSAIIGIVLGFSFIILLIIAIIVLLSLFALM